MKLDTVSVAPPGPPAVTLITMSASFNLKMILMMRTVMLTGSMIGNVTCQNDCHPLAPSTLAASSTLGHRLKSGEQEDHDEGNRDPGIHRFYAQSRGPRRGEERWIVPPEIARQRGRRTKTVLHERLADHPAHGDRTEHQRQQENDAKKLSRSYLGVQQQSQSKRNRILSKHRHRVEDHIAERIPVVGIVKQSDQIVEAVKVRAFKRTQVPIQRSDVNPK